MTQKTRNVIANVLLGIDVAIILVFLARQFMTPPRPSWTKDYVFVGMLLAIASYWIRVPRWRRHGRGSETGTQ